MHSVIIVGAGLVGCMAGCFMAKRGFDVKIYEKKSDMCMVNLARGKYKGKSINLSLSNRGRISLHKLNMEKDLLGRCIPMNGRFVHHINGKTQSLPYDRRTKQSIYSIGRNFLNTYLLNALSKYDSVHMYFDHKLMDANLDTGEIVVMNLTTKELSTASADLIIGADGAHSVVRRIMEKTPLFNINQTYIDHGYMELSIPPKSNMVPNHLHIWPRKMFMMIALPNDDGSWTVTLFMPFTTFGELNDRPKLLKFFETNFLDDALSLIGRDKLVQDFLNSKALPLVSIKCYPYHYGQKFVLIGDAAHAILPFYGQGMNAGFEDCLLLDKILNSNNNDIGKSINQFTDERCDDCHAISDLAMYNYIEMRDLVTKPTYRIRKMLDEVLSILFPHSWIPLYNSVTFSSMKYRKCAENKAWQDMMLNLFAAGLSLLIISVIIGLFNHVV